jgi:hypothetical protein
VTNQRARFVVPTAPSPPGRFAPGGIFEETFAMSATIDDSNACDTDGLNVLLCGEMAAVEAYTQALGLFNDEMVIADLQKLRDEHSRAVRQLRDCVIGSGGRPNGSPGPWAAFASDDTAGKVIGPATALAALRQGEEHRVNEYEVALERADIRPECQNLLRADLLPACRKHVEELNRLLGGMN